MMDENKMKTINGRRWGVYPDNVNDYKLLPNLKSTLISTNDMITNLEVYGLFTSHMLHIQKIPTQTGFMMPFLKY